MSECHESREFNVQECTVLELFVAEYCTTTSMSVSTDDKEEYTIVVFWCKHTNWIVQNSNL